MKKQNQVLRETAPLLRERFGEETAAQVLADAQRRFAALCAENAGESRAVQAHTVGSVYPCIGLYEGLLRAGIGRQEAVDFLDWSFSKRAEKKAASMRAMMKLPGLYKQMPAIFKWVAKHQFGEQAGFQARFYDTGHGRCRFDMTRCVYCDTFRKYGCPELTICLCHTDDVTNSRIHPKIRWHRTQIMGDGGAVCDFDLFRTDKKA